MTTPVRYIHALAIVFLLPLTLAQATAATYPDIVAPSPSDRASLTLYETPGVRESTRNVPVNNLGFPLKVLDVRQGYQQIRFDAQTYWVRSGQVRNATPAKGSCLPTPPSVNQGAERIGATPGINKPYCN